MLTAGNCLLSALGPLAAIIDAAMTSFARVLAVGNPMLCIKLLGHWALRRDSLITFQEDAVSTMGRRECWGMGCVMMGYVRKCYCIAFCLLLCFGRLDLKHSHISVPISPASFAATVSVRAHAPAATVATCALSRL